MGQSGGFERIDRASSAAKWRADEQGLPRHRGGVRRERRPASDRAPKFPQRDLGSRLVVLRVRRRTRNRRRAGPGNAKPQTLTAWPARGGRIYDQPRRRLPPATRGRGRLAGAHSRRCSNDNDKWPRFYLQRLARNGETLPSHREETLDTSGAREIPPGRRLFLIGPGDADSGRSRASFCRSGQTRFRARSIGADPAWRAPRSPTGARRPGPPTSRAQQCLCRPREQREGFVGDARA